MYGEPIGVTAQGNEPVSFAWRGHSYTVRAVLEHWVVSREWWQRNDPDSEAPPEREFWRVEASPSPSVPSAIYELRCDADTGDWLLIRVWD